MQKRRAASTGVTGVLVLALALTGCGDGEKEVTSESSEVPAVDVNPVDREDVKRGGTLRWPISELPTQWNVAHLNGATVPTAEVTDALLPSPFAFDEKANPTPNPDLVTNAELTSTDPKQQVTYDLNPKATWSDGEAITWQDFRYQWKALSGEDQRFRGAASEGYDRIENVSKGENARQVVVTYAEPFGDWEAVFDPLLPKSITSDPNAFNKGWRDGVPVSGGPFRFDEVDEKAGTVRLTRNPNWWGEPAKLDAIEFRAIPPSEQVRAFENDEIDFVSIGTNGAAYKAAKTTPGTDVRKAAAPDYAVVTFNGSSPILSNVDIRKAIALAVDRERIARSALSAVDYPVIPMQNHFFVNTQAGYQDNAGDLSTPDPTAAGELLDKAGWKLKGKKRVKDGEQLTIRFVSPKGSDRSKQVGTLMRQMLGKIGVDLKVQEVPMEDFFDSYVTTGDFDLAPSAWQGTPFPVSSSRSIYAMPTKDARGDLVIQQNFSRIGSEQIDQLMDNAIDELDVSAAREQTNQADQVIWDAVHSLPLYQQPQIRACRQDLANFGANGFKSVIHQNIGFTSSE